MAKLIYPAITSLDGYVEDEQGNFDWAAPDDEVHAFVNDLERPIGTYLYGRRMYETMVFWETVSTGADQPAVSRDFAEIWRAAEKIVYSRTLQTVSSARTRIERDLDPDAVRRLKEISKADIAIGGAELAGQALVWGWSTSVICSSDRSWWAAASARCLTTSARSSSSSTSAGSETASFIFITASAADPHDRRQVMPVINARTLGTGNLKGTEHGATISLILDQSEPGHGPRLHRHPYDETWVVQEGNLTFRLGDERHRAGPGDIIIAPPGVPHKFTNDGPGPCNLVCIHANPEMVTEWLERAADAGPPAGVAETERSGYGKVS